MLLAPMVVALTPQAGHAADTPAVALSATTVGNVFTVGRLPNVDVTTAGDTLAWSATDATGTVVARGRQTVTGGRTALRLPIDRVGWFSIAVTASRAGTVLGTATTTLARLNRPAPATNGSSPFGVSAHYGFTGTSTKSIPLLAKAGLTNERDEMMWGSVERTKGSYVFPHDAYADQLAENGVSPLIILDYGNPNYDGGKAPTSAEAIAAFAKYANALVEHNAGKVSSYEIWNEWNIGFGDTPRTPESYLALQKATYETVKPEHPDITLVAPTLAGTDMQWLEQWMKLGGLRYTDAISLHPYLFPQAPEGLDAVLAQLQHLIKQYNGGKSKPIWISEQGWPTGTSVVAGSETQQAANVARSALIALAGGAERYFAYDFVNDGTDPGNLEHNFGLLHNAADPLGAYTPKPAYAAYAALTRQLSGATFSRKETVGTGVHDLVFDRNGRPLRALWSQSPTVVSLHADKELVVTDLYGNSETYAPDHDGVITLTLTGDPLYVTGPVDAVTAGGTVSLSARPAFVGDPLVVDWAADNTAGHKPLALRLELGGGTYRLDVPAGQSRTRAISLPAPSGAGDRALVGDLYTAHRRIGRIRTDVTVRSALQLQAKHVLDSSGAQQVRFTVSNLSASSHTLGSLNWTVGSTDGTALQDVTVPGHAQRQVDVPLTAGAKSPYTARLTVQGLPAVDLSGTVMPVAAGASAPVPRRTITVDGRLDDLTGLSAIQLPQDGKVRMSGYGGASDLGGSLWFSYDQQNLYLSAEITDDVHSQPETGSSIWQGDSLQFAIGSGAPGEQTAWSEIGAALTPSGPQLYRWVADGENSGAIPGAQVAVTRDDMADRTTYEVAIPWSRLQPIEPADRLISLSLLANDNDGSGRRGWIEWGGGIGSAKDSALFKPAELIG
ncbi:sugar-binding protein [Streptomyces sp. NPDC004752]